MRIFFDTNIVIEFLEHRNQADAIERILDICDNQGHEKFISVGSFYTIIYIVERHLRQDLKLSADHRMGELRKILSGILAEFRIAGHTSLSLQNGIVDSAFMDLEDSCQAQAAIHNNCNIFLTINNSHFAALQNKDSITLMTPNEFLVKCS